MRKVLYVCEHHPALGRDAVGSYAAELHRAIGATGEFESQLVTRERFPYLAPLVASGAYAESDGEDEQDDFAFGLERILDGIAAYVAARRSGEPVTAYEERPEPIPRDKAVREAAKARREAESKLREARKHEREAIARARERAAR